MNKLYKRILSAVLALVTLATNFPAVASASGDFVITCDGETVSCVELYENEKLEISAENQPEGCTLQWQLLIPDTDTWVDVEDQTEQSLRLTFALLGNLLDEDNNAYVRCAALMDGESAAYTQSLQIAVVVRDITSQATESASMMFTMTRSTDSDSTVNAASIDDSIELVSVTIEYYYEDRNGNKGDMVMDPYVARIPVEDPLNVTVPCKIFPGYEINLIDPIDGVSLIDDQVVVALDSVTSNQTIEVHYKEIQVPYYARFFMQNIYNDLYTEQTDILTDEEKESMVGYAGDQPDDSKIHPDVSGFTALFHQPDTIAADGSTVFEVYYDRNYYLINFDLDGGYGTAPVYARYETSFTVATPTRPGYSFDGWELISGTVPDGAETDANGLVKKIPASNLTYRAKWTQGDTSYTVIYWAENANPEIDGTYKYSYWGSQSISALSGKEVSAADYSTAPSSLTDAAYFTYNSEKTMEDEREENPDYDSVSEKVIVNGDGSTILNVYFTRNTYELRFLYARKYSDTQYYLINNNPSGTLGVESCIGPVDNLPEITHPENYTYVLSSEEIEYGSNTYTYYYLSLKAKYNAYIGDIWPANAVGTVEQGTSTYKWGSWGTQAGSGYRAEHDKNANIVGAYPILSADMIIDPSEPVAQRLIAWWPPAGKGGIALHAYHIYVESLDETYDDEINGVKYDLDRTEVFSCAHNGSTRVDPFEYTGLTRVKDIENESNLSNSSLWKHNGCDQCPEGCDYHNNFYYIRNSDQYFSLYNYSKNITNSDGEDMLYLPYGTSLSSYELSKELMEENYYPEELEPNAYVFDGWYTTGQFFDGTEVDWTTLTMPDSNLTVYAKWTPKTYNTYFYLDYDRYNSGDVYVTVSDTPHGENMIMGEDEQNKILYPEHDIDDSYQFIGWFYIDPNGKKVAFNPSEMAVRQELHLYAEWSTTTVKEYTVSYKLGKWDDSAGTVIPIEEGEEGYRVLSADTTGYAFEATTRTFTAKSEDQLENLTQEEWEESIWVPHTNSHSILMKADNNENVFTFWYVPRTNIPYTVRYLDATTGESVIVDGAAKPDKVVDSNSDAVVTEQFVYVPGYIPDAFYKTLVLSANDAENVINFYYTKDESYEEDSEDDEDDDPDTQSARYLVSHYIQDIGAETYSIYTTEDLIGIVGETVSAEALDVPGFSFCQSKTETENAETTTVESVNGKWIVSGTVTTGEQADSALKLDLYYERNKYNYTVYYREQGTTTDLKLNDGTETPITHSGFYFDEVVTETAPEIDGYDLYGSNTQTLKISSTENLNVITFEYTPKPLVVHYVAICTNPDATEFGYVLTTSEYQTINGTTAIAKSGFRFIGWYSDEACTQKVSGESLCKPNISAENGIYEYTFYALFEPITLTITQSGMNGSDSGIYQIVNSSDVVVSTIVITGNSSATIEQIPSGTYTVREITGNWTWTYNDTTEQSVDLTSDTAKTVEFSYTAKETDWLGGESDVADNNFT